MKQEDSEGKPNVMKSRIPKLNLQRSSSDTQLTIRPLYSPIQETPTDILKKDFSATEKKADKYSHITPRLYSERKPIVAEIVVKPSSYELSSMKLLKNKFVGE